MEEIWKKIDGFENYEVSNKGNVRSLNYNNTGKPKNLKQKINRYGYNEVKLSKNNKTKNFLVSTLVGKHFLNNKSPDKKIMHIGDVKKNDIKNLKYGYISEIKYTMYKNGKRKIGKPSKYNFSFDEKQYKTFSELARDNNLKPKLLFKRLSNGWTLKEAVEIPKNRKEKILKKALYEYNGKLMSIKQLSEISGHNESMLYKRLSRGWTVEEAVEIPNLNVKENKNE